MIRTGEVQALSGERLETSIWLLAKISLSPLLSPPCPGIPISLTLCSEGMWSLKDPTEMKRLSQTLDAPKYFFYIKIAFHTMMLQILPQLSLNRLEMLPKDFFTLHHVQSRNGGSTMGSWGRKGYCRHGLRRLRTPNTREGTSSPESCWPILTEFLSEYSVHCLDSRGTGRV